MSAVDLTIAVGDYDHIRDVTSGRIAVPGVSVRSLALPVEEIFARFFEYREWEVSEFSFGKYSALVAAGDRSLVGLPVFPSRMFRHSSMYVRTDSEISSPSELAGRRIGIPEWAQTAAIYSRGILADVYGVPLSDVEWVQAGVNSAGRREKVTVNLPEGVSLTRVDDRSLNEMLVAGDLDAVFSARPPVAFSGKSGVLRRLVSDYPVQERNFYESTGVFPIMHVLVMRADVHERHPWIAKNLVDAFDAAKRASLARLGEITASWIPLPWVSAQVEAATELFGDDPWPYGVEPNRKTLETFLRWGFEQGVCADHLAPEELFAQSTLGHVIV